MDGRGGEGRAEASHSQVIVQNEEILASILHDVLAEVLDEEAYVRRAVILASGRQLERVATFVAKEHLKSAAGEAGVSTFGSITHTPSHTTRENENEDWRVKRKERRREKGV